MTYAKTSLRREKRDLRDRMRSMGLGYRGIAAEFARRYSLRPRAAWREACGWSLQDTADRINDFRGNTGLDPGGFAGMTAPHLSEYERWPGHAPEPSGRRPTPYLLAVLAAVYDCAVTDLVDLPDRERFPPHDLLILDRYSQPAGRPVQLSRTPAARAAEELRNQREVFLPDAAHADAGLDLGGPRAAVLPSLGPGEGQEGQDPVRRRSFVGLTGVSLISAVLGEAASAGAPAETEPFAVILTGNAAGVASSEPGSLAGTRDAGTPNWPATCPACLPGLIRRARCSRATPGARRASPRRTPITSLPGCCSSLMTRACPASPRTAACARRRPAGIR
jgi:hypothetical protein